MKVFLDKRTPLGIAVSACLRLLALYVALGFLLRIALAFHPITGDLAWWQWGAALGIGIVNDAAMATLMLIPLGAFLMSSGHWKLRRPQCCIIAGLLAALWLWLAFGCRQLRDFNAGLSRALGFIALFWLITFAVRALVPSIRAKWMQTFTALILFIYTFLIYLNICSEWLFWNEFGVRYNFIAVDYLVYTSEVVGNIMQSYSIGWIFGSITALALITLWLLMRKVITQSATIHLPGWRMKFGAGFLAAAAVSFGALTLTRYAQQSRSAWFNELQASGPYSFAQAFLSNRLDYRDFYVTLPDSEAQNLMSDILYEEHPDDTSIDPQYPNIVLITMESMSADYMKRFGNDEGLTPCLDSLWNRSLAFDRLFAAGNRTVRGLEALVMSRPPTPGESIIKRPGDTPELPSIIGPLKENGYSCLFYYGGDSYFDNMESFFSRLGYGIRDRKSMADADISCQTVWGVCDGDVYDRLIADLDNAFANGERIFAHLLTTSNHRPYIYPEGCVAIPPSQKSRKGAVMYSDYALGRFIETAGKRPWGENTVFVIVADHCASSAGSTELPLSNYHIPALIYAPSLIEPQVVDKTASQIDIMPTLFARLGWKPAEGIFGRDILDPQFTQRAPVATYQDLGYLEGDTLTVLSPGSKCRQFVVEPSSADPFAMREVDPSPASPSAARAAALYQTSSDQIDRKP